MPAIRDADLPLERRRNRIELGGSVAGSLDRRETPAGTPVVSFRLRVDADPSDPGLRGFSIRVVCLGDEGSRAAIEVGSRVWVAGALTERRWKRPSGMEEARYEVLADTIHVL